MVDGRDAPRAGGLPVPHADPYAEPWYVTRNNVYGESRAKRELGLEPRPFEDSVRDTLAWMAGTGRLKPSLFGTLAHPAA